MKKNYRFGIDIDGTVTTPEFMLPYLNKAFQTNLTLDDIKTYDLTKVFPVDSSIFSNWFKENELTLYKNPPIQSDAKRILTGWYPSVELNYITARDDNSRDVTYNWFNHYQVPYDQIDIVGYSDKVPSARKHGVQLFMEDKHSNAVRLHEELDIPVLLFDAPYNREPIPNGVIRIKNWLEAEHWVKKEFGV